MKPRRTVVSTRVFRLEGGNEDNDLWITDYGSEEESNHCLGSTWVPTDDERKAIADGANLEMLVWGDEHPPVVLRLSTYTLGKAPSPL